MFGKSTRFCSKKFELKCLFMSKVKRKFQCKHISVQYLLPITFKSITEHKVKVKTTPCITAIQNKPFIKNLKVQKLYKVYFTIL